MRIELLPHTSFMKNGKFDKEAAILYSAQLAGVCYEPEGYNKLKDEDKEKTLKRLNRTLSMEHATPYEHIVVGVEITNVPKIIAMILNNEKQCSTSEKSARYTKITTENVSENEALLYTKWMDIFKDKISNKYGDEFNKSKIEKLAQENARYLVSVFCPTKIVHTLPWIQLNRIVSFMIKFTRECDCNEFNKKLCVYFEEFISLIKNLDILDDRAMSNRKNRGLSLFGRREVEKYFGESYSISYRGSFAQLAQAHRHRTISYNLIIDDSKEFYIPPIISDDEELVDMWIKDINTSFYPQGQMFIINEVGSYDNFILKTKERLCSAAQLEINDQTKLILTEYEKELNKKNHYLVNDIKNYTKGAKCTFKDYDCALPCGFKEGILLKRKI